MDVEPVDELAVMIAAMDQFRMHIPHIAGLSRAWFEGFVDHGFDGEQALRLTIALTKGVVGLGGSDGN